MLVFAAVLCEKWRRTARHAMETERLRADDVLGARVFFGIILLTVLFCVWLGWRAIRDAEEDLNTVWTLDADDTMIFQTPPPQACVRLIICGEAVD